MKRNLKHVIITGGAGFIGSHLCDALLQQGYAVTAMDNLITGQKDNLTHASSNPHFQFVNRDVCEGFEESELPFLKQYGLHGIFHFACPASPIDFERIPFEILKVDSFGTHHSVQLALQYKARYLLASTSEVYGDPLVHPQKEDYFGNVNSTGVRSCYDETKRFAEAYVSTAIRGSGLNRLGPLNGAIVRIFNTYGPRMRPNDGRVIPEFCTRALQNKPLPIHGKGEQTRSFCFISDLVEGILKLFHSNIKEVVNLGNPTEISVMTLAQEIHDAISKPLKVQTTPARPDDPKQRCPDISRAKSLLEWQPKISLQEGLQVTLEYFKSHPEVHS